MVPARSAKSANTAKGAKRTDDVPKFQACQTDPFKNGKQGCLLRHMLQRYSIEKAEKHDSRHVVPGQRGERIAWNKNFEQTGRILDSPVSHPADGKRLRDALRQQYQEPEGNQPERRVEFPT